MKFSFLLLAGVWLLALGVLGRQKHRRRNTERICAFYVGILTLGFWRFGVFGVLVFWCFGVLAFWRFGVLAFWRFGVLALGFWRWSFGVVLLAWGVYGVGSVVRFTSGIWR